MGRMSTVPGRGGLSSPDRNRTGPELRLAALHSQFYIIFLIFFNVYLFLRDRETERQRETESEGGGAEREGDTESEAGSRL